MLEWLAGVRVRETGELVLERPDGPEELLRDTCRFGPGGGVPASDREAGFPFESKSDCAPLVIRKSIETVKNISTLFL